MIRRPPRSPLFPYPPLFRSRTSPPAARRGPKNSVVACARRMGDVTLLVRPRQPPGDRKSTRLNSSHLVISYAVFCLKKKKNKNSYVFNALQALEQHKLKHNT